MRRANSFGRIQVLYANRKPMQWPQPFSFGESFVRSQGLRHQLIFGNQRDNLFFLVKAAISLAGRKHISSLAGASVRSALARSGVAVGWRVDVEGSSGESVALTAALVPSFKASRRVIFSVIQHLARIVSATQTISPCNSSQTGYSAGSRGGTTLSRAEASAASA